jgi:transcriptional regulator with XRE-family HTH domain
VFDPLQDLGPRLKAIRLASEKSLREVARTLDVSPSFLSQIENGKSLPSVATLFLISRYHGVSIDALFAATFDVNKSRNLSATSER